MKLFVVSSAVLLSLLLNLQQTAGQEIGAFNYTTVLGFIDTLGIELPENSTVFAPTNAAFEYLQAEEPDNWAFLSDPANEEILTNVILYHVIPDFFLNSTTIATGDYPTMAPGEALRIAVTDSGAVIINENANVIQVDILLGNTTIVHGIDQVLTSSVQETTRVPTASPPTAPPETDVEETDEEGGDSPSSTTSGGVSSVFSMTKFASVVAATAAFLAL